MLFDCDGSVASGLAVNAGDVYFTCDDLQSDWCYLFDGQSKVWISCFGIVGVDPGSLDL